MITLKSEIEIHDRRKGGREGERGGGREGDTHELMHTCPNDSVQDFSHYIHSHTLMDTSKNVFRYSNI